jgi:hypothetical protein
VEWLRRSTILDQNWSACPADHGIHFPASNSSAFFDNRRPLIDHRLDFDAAPEIYVS